jgi:hypothetical protein
MPCPAVSSPVGRPSDPAAFRLSAQRRFAGAGNWLSSRSRQNPTKCLVRLIFSDEARELTRLSIAGARLFFISVQKMNRNKKLG